MSKRTSDPPVIGPVGSVGPRSISDSLLGCGANSGSLPSGISDVSPIRLPPPTPDGASPRFSASTSRLRRSLSDAESICNGSPLLAACLAARCRRMTSVQVVSDCPLGGSGKVAAGRQVAQVHQFIPVGRGRLVGPRFLVSGGWIGGFACVVGGHAGFSTRSDKTGQKDLSGRRLRADSEFRFWRSAQVPVLA